MDTTKTARRFDFSDARDVAKISKRIATSYRKLSGRTDGIEDCTQGVLCAMLEGRHQHATIDQAVIEYLRKRSGRKGTNGYALRQSLENSYTAGAASTDIASSNDPRRRLDIGRDCNELLRGIGNQVDRACYLLNKYWELNEIEVGNIFGFSESRVCQRIQRVQSSLSARIKAQKSRLESERAKKVAGILPAETKRVVWGVGQISFERMARVESFRVATINEASF